MCIVILSIASLYFIVFQTDLKRDRFLFTPFDQLPFFFFFSELFKITGSLWCAPSHQSIVA